MKKLLITLLFSFLLSALFVCCEDGPGPGYGGQTGDQRNTGNGASDQPGSRDSMNNSLNSNIGDRDPGNTGDSSHDN